MSSFTLTDRFPCSTQCSALTHGTVKCFQKGAAVFYPQNSLCLLQVITIILFRISLKVQVPRNSWAQETLRVTSHTDRSSLSVYGWAKRSKGESKVRREISLRHYNFGKILKTPGSEHLCHPWLLNKTKSSAPALHWAGDFFLTTHVGLCFRSGTKGAWATHWWFIIAEQCLNSIYTSFASHVLSMSR